MVSQVAVGGGFPAQSDLSCPDGGGVTFGNVSPTGFLAVFTGCVNGPWVSNGTMTVTNMVLQPCDQDGQISDVPASLGAVVNGSVTAGGVTTTLSDFGVQITNLLYAQGAGGTCALLEANIHATGRLVDAQNSATVDLGSASLDLGFADNVDFASFTVGGVLTVETPCTDGAFSIAFANSSPLEVPSGATKPTNGSLTANGELVDYATGPSAVLCGG